MVRATPRSHSCGYTALTCTRVRLPAYLVGNVLGVSLAATLFPEVLG